MPHKMHRKCVILDGKMLKEFEVGTQEKLLSTVQCPVFLIHGDGDDEERFYYQLSQAGMQYLPKESKLKLYLEQHMAFGGTYLKFVI